MTYEGHAHVMIHDSRWKGAERAPDNDPSWKCCVDVMPTWNMNKWSLVVSHTIYEVKCGAIRTGPILEMRLFNSHCFRSTWIVLPTSSCVNPLIDITNHKTHLACVGRSTWNVEAPLRPLFLLHVRPSLTTCAWWLGFLISVGVNAVTSSTKGKDACFQLQIVALMYVYV